MTETFTKTMTRKQRFQLQEPSWSNGINTERANTIVKLYEQLPQHQKDVIDDNLDEFINTSQLYLSLCGEAMLEDIKMYDDNGKLLDITDIILLLYAKPFPFEFKY